MNRILDTLTRQDIQNLAVMMLIMFAIFFSYVLYQGASDDRGRLEKILQQQGNLTSEQREKLIVALNDNIEVIPVLKNQTREMLNTTNQMLDFIQFITQSFDEEYLADEMRQYAQSNNTQVKLDRILEALNATH
jgi:hypothetical protein